MTSPYLRATKCFLAVLQHSQLNAVILPPRNLPYAHVAPRVLAEQTAQLRVQEEWETQEEQELLEAAAEEQQETREWQEDAAHRRNRELCEALTELRMLQEGK